MVKRIILKNGLRIILVPQKGLATTVLVLVEAGSEYETKRINGISHFLEHLAFKGTTRRPKPGLLAAELDALGAEYNAFTSQEYTGYWAKAQNEKLPQLLDIVSDLYLNPIFNAEELEKERGVIIEEINMYEDMPMRRVQDLFMEVLYGDQPAGWDIAGRKEIVRRLKRDDLLVYRSKHYVPQATVVVVSGDFNIKKAVKDVTNIFGGLKKRAKGARLKTREHQKKPALLFKFKESDQTHLVLGVRIFDIFDERRYALQVLADILGGGMSSRLFQRLRNELGAAYYIHASSELFLDHGYLSVSAGVDNRKIELVIKTILDELRRVTKEPIGLAELKKAKDHLIGNFLLGLETSDELAGFYGGQEILTRRLLQPRDIIAKIQKVRTEDLKKLSRAIFIAPRLNLAFIGPHKREGAFEKIFRFN